MTCFIDFNHFGLGHSGISFFVYQNNLVDTHGKQTEITFTEAINFNAIKNSFFADYSVEIRLPGFC